LSVLFAIVVAVFVLGIVYLLALLLCVGSRFRGSSNNDGNLDVDSSLQLVRRFSGATRALAVHRSTRQAVHHMLSLRRRWREIQVFGILRDKTQDPKNERFFTIHFGFATIVAFDPTPLSPPEHLLRAIFHCASVTNGVRTGETGDRYGQSMVLTGDAQQCKVRVKGSSQTRQVGSSRYGMAWLIVVESILNEGERMERQCDRSFLFFVVCLKAQ
jgi:hypothetical protein